LRVGCCPPASFSVLWALTRFAIVLPTLATTLMLTELREPSPMARSPSAQLIGRPRRGVQVPFVVVTPRNNAPVGTGLVSTTLCAVSGPAFDTVITYEICAPFFADVGPAMLTATSALGGGGVVVTKVAKTWSLAGRTLQLHCPKKKLQGSPPL
jgi:hypothetical protein